MQSVYYLDKLSNHVVKNVMTQMVDPYHNFDSISQ